MLPSLRPLRAMLSLLAAALLAACSSDSNKNPFQVTVQRCPAVAVVGGTGSLTRFRGTERNAEDILYKATITATRLKCHQGDDVVSDVAFEIVAQRGPALRGEADVALPYFVAVLRDNSEIVAKDVYLARLHFSADAERTGTRELIRQRLPTIDQARRYDYEILLGFQLNPEDVTYNLLR
ncbi:MAG: hypothetical protein ACE5ED_01270 [Rhodothalassiaceae bacterium]